VDPAVVVVKSRHCRLSAERQFLPAVEIMVADGGFVPAAAISSQIPSRRRVSRNARVFWNLSCR